MAAGTGVAITGGPETARAFDQLAEDVSNLGPTHHKIATARLGGVRSRSPVRTGALAGSWSASSDSSGGSITSDVSYAPVLEYGSIRGVSAVAMVARTLEAEQTELLEEYQAAILERARARGFRVG